MAVPKKRTGHSAQGHRRSNWKATKPETTKGKPVSLKDRVEEVAVEEKKPAKKSTKKAEKAEETKVEEVKAEVVEEVKDEAPAEETSETEEK